MSTGSPTKVQQACSLCDQGRWEEALTFAQDWQADTPAEAKAFFYQAVALTGLGQFAAAERAYRHSLTLNDHDFHTWNNLAVLLFNSMQQPAEGAKCLAQALQVDPGNKLGWANLASMYGQLGRYAQTLECTDRALALDPEMVEALLHRARAAQALGRSDIVRGVSEVLARLPPEKFKRSV